MAGTETVRRLAKGLDLSGVDAAFAARFWAKVAKGDPSSCWEWTAHTKANGYGQFTVRKGYFVGAHTVSFALSFGPIEPGHVICHRCDNPPCVNPAHLFVGTQSDNMRDAFAKGRATRSTGIARENARLTDDVVRLIRAADPEPGLITHLASDFGVSRTTIRRVRSGIAWAHVS